MNYDVSASELLLGFSYMFRENEGKINNASLLSAPRRIGMSSVYRCYHCEHESPSAHLITFFQGTEERDELLCDSCYADWLEGLKVEP